MHLQWLRIMFAVLFLQTPAAHAALTLEVGQGSGTPGAVLSLPITVTHDTTAVGFMVDLTYDADALTLALPEEASSVSHLIRAGSPNTGVLRLAAVPKGAASGVLPQSLVVNLQLTINANATTDTFPLALSNLQVSDAFGVAVGDANVMPGAVDVRTTNQPPTATLNHFNLQEDSPFADFLTATDTDGDPLAFAILTPPIQGTVLLTNVASGAFTYVPNLNAEGSDRFAFHVSDGMAVSAPAFVDLTIQPVNDAPSAASAFLESAEDQTASAIPTIMDVDANDTHSLTIVSAPSHGSANVTGNQLSYTPQRDYFGNDQFVFQATDLGNLSVQGIASVEIAAVNDAPTAVTASFDLAEDNAQTFQPLVEDVDSDHFSFSVITPPQHGTVAIHGDAVTFTPTPDFNGVDAFVLRTYDESLAFLDTQINVTVTATNDPPTSAMLEIVVCSEQESDAATPTVTDVDLDYEGDQYTFELLSQPNSGNVTLLEQEFFYTSDEGFLGQDTFQFNVTDSGGATVTGTAQVQVVALDQVFIAGNRAQGLEPMVFTADTNCGVENTFFAWFEVESGILLGTGLQFELNPPPPETTLYELAAQPVGDQPEVRETFRVLVHPQGVDLNGDGMNSIADFILAASSWRMTDSTYEADGRAGLTILDFLYINLGSP
jgi:hypothetical protein